MLTPDTIASALGGIGLFLLGMSMMTEGLKAAAGGALRDWLARATRTVSHSLAAGFLITALVQSSSAVTVATIGLVNAGLLGLKQAMWLVFGTNVGTTMTGWVVALIGFKFDVAALALPMIGFGIAARIVAGGRDRIAGAGGAIAGFGLFFLGISFLQNGFAHAADTLVLGLPAEGGFAKSAMLVAIGAALTVLMQSSSAALAVTLAASVGGGLGIEALAAVVVGTNIGTTSTALFAGLGATSAARRVAAAHIIFNLATAAVSLAVLPQLVALSAFLVGAVISADAPAATLAVFHTVFNVLGVVLMLPAGGLLVGRLARMFASEDEAVARPKFLDAGLETVPALAAGGLIREGERHLAAAAAAVLATGDKQPRESGGGKLKGPASVRDLGVAIRAFLVRLGKSPLSADVSRALPHVLRASQHADALAGIALPEMPPSIAAGSPVAGGVEIIEKATRDCLALAVESDGDTARIRATTGEVEGAYEALKSTLLSATASGVMDVQEFDQMLDDARSYRAAARLAWKAHNRLVAARAAFGMAGDRRA
jgi:phosphate:Na+ symporter